MPVQFPRIDAGFLSAISVVLSVFIIIITLIENSRNYQVEAEHSTETAHALEKLYNRYEAFLLGWSKEGTEESYRNEYGTILSTARTERKFVDYHLFQLSNASALKLGKVKACGVTALFFFEVIAEYWLYATMAFAPPLVVLAILAALT